MLTLGWSDGHTFMPIDFSLLSSKTSPINGINEGIDKRCSGYRRRVEALQSAPQGRSYDLLISHTTIFLIFSDLKLIESQIQEQIDNQLTIMTAIADLYSTMKTS